ncbi:MAG: hypothetical protein ABIH76_02080 [Candidatus Bathyarchaeota archaeon]
MSKLLKGKIARILTPHSVVITVGRIHGAREGMKFIIYEEGEMITDPDTFAEIERLELVKGRVEVTNVQEKVSIAESFHIEKKVYDPMYITTLKMFQPTEREVVVKDKLVENEIQPPKIPPVKEGNLVRQIEQT